MAYTHKGKKITHNSGTKKATKSGIKSAKVGDTYLNTKLGHVYRCTKEGKPKDAEWEYVRTDIIGAPKGKATVSAPERQSGGSHAISVSWKVSSDYTDEKKGDRATSQVFKWRLDVEELKSKGKKKKKLDPYDKESDKRIELTSDEIDLNDFTPDNRSRALTRADFYPVKSSRHLVAVLFSVTLKNKKGNGKAASQKLEFKVPKVPTLSTPAIDSGGKVSCTITTDPGNDEAERYDTRYQVDILESETNRWINKVDLTTTDTEKTVSWDVPNWQTPNRYTKVRFRAQARGYAGDSAWSAYETHVVGWPNQPVISGGISIPGASTATSIVTVPVKVGADANHATDEVVLCKLFDSTAKTPAEAIADPSAWVETDYKDNGSCTALACTVGELKPSAGKTTWVRLKAWHDVEGVFFRYSEPKRLTALETSEPTAADDVIALISAETGSDGRSAVVQMAWNADGRDDSTGTQLSWSDASDAWDSTDQPDTYEFTESDGTYTHGSKTYRDSRKITIKGLAEGLPAYVKARRYMDDDDGNRTYGPWSDMKTVIPSVAPSDVTLMADAFVASGSGVTFSWAYGGGGTQRSWQLVDDVTKAVISEGSDAMGTKTIPAHRATSFAVDGVLRVFVRVSTGGDPVASAARSVRIVPAPTLSMGSLPTLAAQPLSIPLTCSTSTCKVAITVTACGITRQEPDGETLQPAGDCVWTDSVEPRWSASGGSFTATVTTDTGVAFVDGASYDVTAVATDMATGLRSNSVTCRFKVGWRHQAAKPPDGIQVEPETYVDEDGMTWRRATITLVAPAGAEEGDVYDVYRLTHDGAALIGSSIPLASTVVDDYAPFGDESQSYRIACRTADGDEEWRDYDYYLGCESIRFDFDGDEAKYVELPYNIGISDTFSKDFENRVHMDGSRGGGWNDGIGRKASITSDIIRLEDPETADAVRSLARHAGPVFVRTPDGSAYEANVDVDLELSEDSHNIIACSFDVEETDLTDEFMLPKPTVPEE